MIQRIKKVSPFVEVVFDPFATGGSYRRATKLSVNVQRIFATAVIMATIAGIIFVNLYPVVE